jgi:hypothetical protein
LDGHSEYCQNAINEIFQNQVGSKRSIQDEGSVLGMLKIGKAMLFEGTLLNMKFDKRA